jgi:predicted transcriptional regulator
MSSKGSTAAVAPKERRLRENEKKWTPPVMEAGWTLWPSVFLKYQRQLGLTPLHVNVLLQVARCWFKADSPPYRAKKSIAEALGVSTKTIQRALSELRARGYLEPEKRHDGNGGQRASAYHFGGLIAAARPYAEEMVKQRTEKIAARQKEQRQKPGLRRIK